MYRKIIVGIDGSDRGLDALALGRQLARAEHAGLILAAVHPRDLPPDDANRHLTEARDLLAGVDVVDSVAIGAVTAARGLRDLAETRGADLVVVGSTHRGPVGRVLPGSVGERLIRGAICAIAVAPVAHWSNPDTRVRRISVGYDGSGPSREAVAAAGSLAAALEARVQVIGVVDGSSVATSVIGAGQGFAPVLEAWRDTTRRDCETVVATLPAGVKGETLVADGRPAAVLASASAEADILITGSRGRGSVGRALVGSVAAELMRTAACPLIVVPNGVKVRPEQPHAVAP